MSSTTVVDVAAAQRRFGFSWDGSECWRVGDAVEASVHLQFGSQVALEVTLREWTGSAGRLLGSTVDVVDGVTTGGADVPIRFAIGHGRVAPALELVASQLRSVGGPVEHFVIARSSFLPAPAAEAVPNAPAVTSAPAEEHLRHDDDDSMLQLALAGSSSSKVLCEARLVWVGDPLPLPPLTRETFVEWEARRDTDDRTAFMRDPPPPWSVRLEAARRERELGNDAYHRAAVTTNDPSMTAATHGQGELIAEAVRRYSAGFARLFLSTEEVRFAPPSDSERRLILRERATLHANRAQARLLQRAWRDAAWDASRALELQPDHWKARLRLLSARVASVRETAADQPERVVTTLLRCAADVLDIGRHLAESESLSDDSPVTAVVTACESSSTVTQAAASLRDCAAWIPGESPADVGGSTTTSSHHTAAGNVTSVVSGWGGRAPDPLDHESTDDVHAARRLRRSLDRGAWLLSASDPGVTQSLRHVASLWRQCVAACRELTASLNELSQQRRRAFGAMMRTTTGAPAPTSSPTEIADEPLPDLEDV